MKIVTLAVLILSCCIRPLAAGEVNVSLAEQARQLARQHLLVDTHIDVPYRLEDKWSDVTQRTDDGDFDYVRAREGGLDIPFMSIYTPAESKAEDGNYQLANRLIDRVEALVGRAPDKFVIVRTPQQAQAAANRGLMGLAMGMENGSPLNGKLENVAFFRDRGISYITLAHSLSNPLSDSSYDENRQWNGLSAFGREVVAEMNRRGVMVDISHVTDEAFWQVLELSQVPVIASHSSARHFTPGWERNMSDDMIKALAEHGGVIQVNFGSSFLTENARAWYDEMKAAREDYLAQNGYDEHGDEAAAFRERYREEHPFPYADMGDLMAQFKHIIALAGIDHVGIGSDFDGLGDSLPVGMKDVSAYPNLIEELLRLEYSVKDIRAIMGGNLMRVWQQAVDHAENRRSAG
jgi:membrane dipeptidase